MGTLDTTVPQAVQEAINLLGVAPIVVRRVIPTYDLTTGSPDLSIVSNDIVRATGSFITDGFVAEDVVLTAGFSVSGNNGLFTVTAVSATNLTIEEPLTDETAGQGKTLSRVTDYTPRASPRFGYKDREIDGTTILRGDTYILVPALNIGVAPDPQTDVVIINNTQYKIVFNKIVYSGDLAALYRLQLRV